MVIAHMNTKTWIESPGRQREESNIEKENSMKNLSKNTVKQTTAHTKDIIHHSYAQYAYYWSMEGPGLFLFSAKQILGLLMINIVSLIFLQQLSLQHN